MKDISNFFNVNDYLPIFNGTLLADIIIILALYYSPFIKSRILEQWYSKYGLSAVIADVFIIVIGIIITRAIYTHFKLKWNIIYFVLILVGIQIVHDLLFYAFFSSIPRGNHKMLDFFKDYGNTHKSGAIIGDTIIVILAAVLSSYFKCLSLNTNIIVIIILIYLVPYFIYKN